MSHRRAAACCALIPLTLVNVGRASAQSAPLVVGCYVTTPALSYSASGTPEKGDTSWSHLKLSANGVARRPLLRNVLDARSSWSVHHDSLSVTLSDGLAGWRLRLTPLKDGWGGTATYLSDATMAGRAPVQRAMHLTRESCGAQQSPRIGVEPTIRRLEEQWRAAQQSNDTAAFRRLLAPDVTFIGTSGSLRDREGYIASRAQSWIPRATAFTVDELRLRPYGMAMIVTGRETTTGKGVAARGRFTHVWSPRGNTWVLVALQRTEIAP
ncbi:MAG TPA: nuclear transport factor 2 family protein [Gemmatimonadaceae bacterium]|nr:nuclear transport factor 2 family protein [Gemmatimonadaceae bacterium]